MSEEKLIPENCTIEQLIKDILPPENGCISISFYEDGFIVIASGINFAIKGFGLTVHEAIINLQLNAFKDRTSPYLGFWVGNINWKGELCTEQL